MTPTNERDQIKQALLRIGLGQEDLGGRERASRVSALRRVEMMTRPVEQPDAEPIQTTLDYPVCELGRFCPMPGPAWWSLWRSAAGCDYETGDEREAAAIDRWQRSGGAWEWELRGRPWSRSSWEIDPSPWHEALAALDG